MPSLAHCMAQYDHEQESAANKLLHVLGISMISQGESLRIFMKWM